MDNEEHGGNSRTHGETLYQKMADRKIRVACAQAGILDIYDPSNSLARAQEIYDVAHPAYISAPSEKAIEE
ncbi:MAG: hypothetical protein MUF61_01615, partial [archaeon]|nr:hypothetical protein [archaeon]